MAGQKNFRVLIRNLETGATTPVIIVAPDDMEARAAVLYHYGLTRFASIKEVPASELIQYAADGGKVVYATKALFDQVMHFLTDFNGGKK